MLYNLTFGDVEQGVTKQAKRFNGPIPKQIANKPKLKHWTVFYLNAFYDLDTERSLGEEPSSIPWSKIKEYALFHDFDEQLTLDFLRIIRKADAAYLTKLIEKRKHDAKLKTIRGKHGKKGGKS